MPSRSRRWSVLERASPEAGLRPAIFVCEDPLRERLVRSMVRRLPPLDGEPVVITWQRGLRDRHGAVHAGSFLRQRRIAFDCTRSEFPRIFVHELFHFVWLRSANARRHAFEQILLAEWRAGVRGELGWSAEWRKERLGEDDVRRRSRRWREYCCESFCDTAAWLYSGVRRHHEFTLPAPLRARRRSWFRELAGSGKLRL